MLEADPQSTGLIQPGWQLTQLLFAAATQLTSIMVGATAVSREGTVEQLLRRVPGAAVGFCR